MATISKVSLSKKSSVSKKRPVHQEESGAEEVAPLKSKRTPYFDELEPVASTEEGPEVDPLAPDGESDLAEEVTLDDDELNPFGDKWEQ
jgi:hypothetical protein